MPLRKCISAIFLLVILNSSQATGYINYQLDFEVTLPDSVRPGSVQFTDLDNDGYDDIIVEGDSTIASFSIKENRVLDFFKKQGNNRKTRYAARFIDNDSRLDFVRAVLFRENYPGKVFAQVYLSTNNYLASDTITLIDTLPPPSTFSTGHMYESIDALFLEDSDHDGITELYGKCAIIRDDIVSEPLYVTHLIFPRFKYIWGQDSAVAVNSIPHNSDDRYFLYNDSTSVSIAFENKRENRCYSSQMPCTDEQWFVFYAYIGDSNVCIKEFRAPDICWSFQDNIFRNKLLSSWIGDIITDSPRIEMLINSYATVIMPEPCSSRVQELRLYSLASPNSVAEIWKISIPDSIPFGFLFADANYKNRFFTGRNDRFRAFNGANGQITDSSNILPAETGRMIAYRGLVSGGETFAIFQSDRTLKFYKIDYKVGFDDFHPPTIPKTFVLREPYPNPFNTSLSIPVIVNRKGNLKIEIFDLGGRKVAVVYDGAARPGELRVNWTAVRFASGVYFIKAIIGDNSATAKVMLLK